MEFVGNRRLPVWKLVLCFVMAVICLSRVTVASPDMQTNASQQENPAKIKVPDTNPEYAEPAGTDQAYDVRKLPAGALLTEEAVDYLGVDSFFYVEEINDEIFRRMWKKSFKEDCTVPREDLRYIRCLHKNEEGEIKVGELVMNQAVAETVCGIFRKLYDADYPIESMRLVDDFDASDEDSIMVNNTSAFNFRTVAGTDQISNHAYGLAIDINPYYNVYYIPSENYVFPPEGWMYLDRAADFPYKLEPGDLCYNLFTEAGFRWGGWWTYNTDYQHFEYVPEQE